MFGVVFFFPRCPSGTISCTSVAVGDFWRRSEGPMSSSVLCVQNACDRGQLFSLIRRFPLIDISPVCFTSLGQRLADVTPRVCCFSKRIPVMLAVFACSVYGKNVFSKESEYFHTANVFIFAPKSAEFKHFCSVQGSSPWWPSVGTVCCVDL